MIQPTPGKVWWIDWGMQSKFRRMMVLSRPLARSWLLRMLLGSMPLLAGCETTGPDTESGPDHTVAYYLTVESSVPEITIETNDVAAGKTPLVLKVFGDPPGTFHNFGNLQFSLRAVSSSTNQFGQERSFRTGKRSAPGERIPGLVFFDMNQPTGGVLIDSIPDR